MASEKYPLNTGNSDWKAVEKLLQSEDDAEPEILSKKRYIIFFSILALLLTSGAAYLFISNKSINNTTALAITNISTVQPKNKFDKNINGSPKIKAAPADTLAKAITMAVLVSASQPAIAPHEKQVVSTVKINKEEFLNERLSRYKTDVAAISFDNGITKELQNQQEKFSLKQLPSTQINTSIAGNNQVQPLKLAKKPVFYAGLFLSREMSYVHSYRIAQGNIGYGFLLGFNINRHLSLETGLSKQKKNFTASGDNFSTENLRLRPTTKLTEVKGYFVTTDIPVNIRYNLNKGKLGEFFGTAGFSTLILHRQYYDYHVEKEQGTEILQRSYPAVKKDNKLFSQLNVSAGYEKNIGKIAKLRVEPYYQLPLSKIGLGKVNLSTAGVNVGIVKNF